MATQEQLARCQQIRPGVTDVVDDPNTGVPTCFGGGPPFVLPAGSPFAFREDPRVANGLSGVFGSRRQRTRGISRTRFTTSGRGPSVIPTSPSGFAGASEPGPGGPAVPGRISEREVLGIPIEDIVGGAIDVGRRILGINGGNGGGGQQIVDQGPSRGPCPGIEMIEFPPNSGFCIDLTALPPGGDPAMVGGVDVNGDANGFGAAIKGRFGVGIIPRVEVQSVRRCPRGMALGVDGVCYDGLGRNSPRRAWPLGMKPLLTGGDRTAIRRAASAGRKLQRSKKQLRKAGRALEKAC